MVLIGFLAELITAYTGHERDSYSIAECTDVGNPKSENRNPKQTQNPKFE